MKVFFLYLLIVTHTEVYLIKVPFGYTLRPITCEDAFNKSVTFKIPFTFYKDKVVGAHYCKDIFGNWYWGYEEQLNYDLGH
tara:strand:- start:2272 stop:2514 length:243 start_codon:yes stop_codon:yes gene_type:complete